MNEFARNAPRGGEQREERGGDPLGNSVGRQWNPMRIIRIHHKALSSPRVARIIGQIPRSSPHSPHSPCVRAIPSLLPPRATTAGVDHTAARPFARNSNQRSSIFLATTTIRRSAIPTRILALHAHCGFLPLEQGNSRQIFHHAMHDQRSTDFQAQFFQINPEMDPASIKQMAALLDGVDASLQRSFENMHHGHLESNLERFLKAREGNVTKANKMLMDCLNWRLDNDIDNILSKPILPKDAYDAIRESQLIGMTGYCNEGRPVFSVGVGFSNFDKASVDKYVQSHIQINEYRDRVVLPKASERAGKYVGSCLKILDMTGLKFSALSRIKILTAISTIDDLNYPEKTDTYYIVNAPLGFNACWKAVRPLLQERTKRKIKVLPGAGRDELLKVMDASVIPEFCRSSKEGSGSKKTNPIDPSVSCFSSSHPFHVELWNYINQQAVINSRTTLAPTMSYHVNVPEESEESSEVVHVIESTLERLNMGENGNALSSDSSNHGTQNHALSSDGSSHHGTDDEASSSNNASK